MNSRTDANRSTSPAGASSVGVASGAKRVIELARSSERNAARGKHSNVGACAENLVRQLGARLHEVLAVVEHEQQLARSAADRGAPRAE